MRSAIFFFFLAIGLFLASITSGEEHPKKRSNFSDDPSTLFIISGNLFTFLKARTSSSEKCVQAARFPGAFLALPLASLLPSFFFHSPPSNHESDFSASDLPDVTIFFFFLKKFKTFE